MLITRLVKIVFVAAMAFFATLVSFGNITDYGTNYEFVKHVLSMDTIFPNSTIRYRAITNPGLHTAGYVLIIAAETLMALICWIGAYRMLSSVKASAVRFNRSKAWAIAGLALGFLIWQVGFMSIGGEWFGMWQSKDWNGISSAFHFVATILGVLIFVAMPDRELNEA